MDSHDTYVVSVEPTVEPIELVELKNRLRVLSCDFDAELRDLMIEGRKQVEYDTSRRLCTQTVILYKDGFPAGNTIEIRESPVSSITSIQYVDENVATQTLSTSAYTTDLDGTPPRIILLENQDWEDTEPDYPKSVIVTYVAGYGDQYSVPILARLAIVEWCRMNWGNCDGDHNKYRNLINRLCWTGMGVSA